MPLSPKARKCNSGFTLAELLIALAILGEIATFTIPKIITAQANGRNNAIAKETMATMAGAYQQLQMNNSGSVSFSTTSGDLTQYMNYVARDSTSSIDMYTGGGGGTISCATYTCIKLHSGGILALPSVAFANSTGFIDGILDPEGTVSGRGDSFTVLIYYNGRTIQYGDLMGSAYTPTWFSY